MMIEIAQWVDLQMSAVARWHVEDVNEQVAGDVGSLGSLVVRNHAINFRLWHEEDLARDPLATDSVIAGVKRRIDLLNQQRNNSIEEIDVAVADWLTGRAIIAPPNAPMNSETIGSIADRLSILTLRIYHLREHVGREDAEPTTRQRAADSLHIAERQHANLAIAGQQLVDDLCAARKRHQPFRQLKMYNDPQLNPVLAQRHRKAK